MKIYFAGMVAGLILTGVNAHAATPSLWKNHYLDANGHLWAWGGGRLAGNYTEIPWLPTAPVQIASGFDRMDGGGFLYKTDGTAWKIVEPVATTTGITLPKVQFLGYGITQLQKKNGFDLNLSANGNSNPELVFRDGLLWDGTYAVWKPAPAGSPAADRLIGAGLYRTGDGRIYRQQTFELARSQQPSLKAAWSFISGSNSGDAIGGTAYQGVNKLGEKNYSTSGLLTPHLGISFAVTDQNTLLGWGSNINKLLLDDRTTDRPIAEATILGEGYVKALFGGGSERTRDRSGRGVTDYNHCGEGYVIALKQDGTIWSWGSNWAGQLGTGDTEPRTTPTLATAVGGDYVDFHRAGNCSMVGLKRDGTLWAWGEAKDSPLGDAARTNTAEHLAFTGPGSFDYFLISTQPSALNTQVINTKPILQAQQVAFPAARDMTIPTPVLDIQATSTGPLNKRSITITFGQINYFYIIALTPDGSIATLGATGWQLFNINKPLSAFSFDNRANKTFELSKDLDLTALKGAQVFAGLGDDFFEMLAFGRWKHVLTLE